MINLYKEKFIINSINFTIYLIKFKTNLDIVKIIYYNLFNDKIKENKINYM